MHMRNRHYKQKDKHMKNLWFLLLLPLLLAACSNGGADRVQRKGPAYKAGIHKEDLGRGLVAIHNGDGKVSVSWRYLEKDPIDVTFDLYRKSGNGQETKLNQTPIAESTFFIDNGVDVSAIDRTATHSGHAVIEVDPEGQNQMVLFAGANREITEDYCERLLAAHSDAALVLAQCETSCVEYMLRRAKEAGVRTALNPSPFTETLKDFPYELADILILNEFEGAAITGETEPERAARELQRRNHGEVILTMGADGALFCNGPRMVREPALPAEAVDTTGAGDTFTGYCLHALLSGASPREALHMGAAASAIEVTRPGAAEAIPTREEVLALLAAADR